MGGIGKRRLGNSALEVSVVGLGGNNFGGRIDFAAAGRVVHKALDLGINLIDTADSYGKGARKRGSDESSAVSARTSCSQPSSACRWTTPASSRARRGATSCARSKR